MSLAWSSHQWMNYEWNKPSIRNLARRMCARRAAAGGWGVVAAEWVAGEGVVVRVGEVHTRIAAPAPRRVERREQDLLTVPTTNPGQQPCWRPPRTCMALRVSRIRSSRVNSTVSVGMLGWTPTWRLTTVLYFCAIIRFTSLTIDTTKTKLVHSFVVYVNLRPRLSTLFFSDAVDAVSATPRRISRFAVYCYSPLVMGTRWRGNESGCRGRGSWALCLFIHSDI